MKVFTIILWIGLGFVIGCSTTKQSKEKLSSNLQMYEGHFMYMADAAVFKGCGSEQMIRVSHDMAYIDVERKYLTLVEGGTWVYLSFMGKKQMMANEENRNVSSYIVHELLGMKVDKGCPDK